MIGQCKPTSENGTVLARNGSAVATTTRLVALLRMTASKPRKRADQQREPKFSTAKPDEPSEGSDERTRRECGRETRAAQAVRDIGIA
jgi:hypothetical protein